jgi:hypothetical protein
MLFLRGDSQIALSNNAVVHSMAMGSGTGAGVVISTSPTGVITADASCVSVWSLAAGNSGNLLVVGDRISLTDGTDFSSAAASTGNGVIDSSTFTSGNAGAVSVDVAGLLTIVGTGASGRTGIFADAGIAGSPQTGDAASVAVNAGALSVVNGGQISSSTLSRMRKNAP